MSEMLGFYKNINTFFSNLKEEGMFFAIFGKSFGEWTKEFFANLGTSIYNLSDYAIIIIMIFVLFAMAGSKSVMKYIYWTSIGYLVIKAVGSAVV